MRRTSVPSGGGGAGESAGSLLRPFVVAAVVFVGVRAAYLDVPLERDEGEYAYIAQRALLGEVPYRDAFDQKPPAPRISRVS